MRYGMHVGGCSAALLMLAALASCGGGAGGAAEDSGAGSALPPKVIISDVSISLRSGPLRDVTYAGVPAHEQAIEVGYDGDTSALLGRTIYVRVVQPEHIYFPEPLLEPGAGRSVLLRLTGDAFRPLAEGRMQGTLQVFVCVDNPDCTTQLRNSPLLVDYDIEVRRGIVVSPGSIQQSTDYGVGVAPKKLTVALPPEAAGWTHTPWSTPEGAEPSSSSLVRSWVTRDGDTLTFAPPSDLLPGVYAQEFSIGTVVPDPLYPSSPMLLERKVLLSHTVVPVGIYVATPSSIQVTQSLSGAWAGYPIPVLVSQVGGSFMRLGVRSDSHPPAADGHPMLAHWLREDDLPVGMGLLARVEHCDESVYPPVCLPAGTYRGAVLMRHIAPDGVATDFDIPVTLTITP